MLYKFFFNAEYAEKLLWIQSHLFFQLSELRNAEENPYGFLKRNPHLCSVIFKELVCKAKIGYSGRQHYSTFAVMLGFMSFLRRRDESNAQCF